jgi:hypothetical protein
LRVACSNSNSSSSSGGGGGGGRRQQKQQQKQQGLVYVCPSHAHMHYAVTSTQHQKPCDKHNTQPLPASSHKHYVQKKNIISGSG